MKQRSLKLIWTQSDCYFTDSGCGSTELSQDNTQRKEKGTEQQQQKSGRYLQNGISDYRVKGFPPQTGFIPQGTKWAFTAAKSFSAITVNLVPLTTLIFHDFFST